MALRITESHGPTSKHLPPKPPIVDDSIDNAYVPSFQFVIKATTYLKKQKKSNNNIDNIKLMFGGEKKSKEFISNNDKLINNIFGNQKIRSLYINISLIIFCMLSLNLWCSPVSVSDDIHYLIYYDNIENSDSNIFENNVHRDIPNHFVNDLTITHNIGLFSIIIIFIASIFGLMIPILNYYMLHKISFLNQNNKYINYIIMSLYFIGSFFYFITACLYASIWNKFGEKINENLTSFGGIWFTEIFYIAAIAVIAGIDTKYKEYFNKLKYRIYVFGILYLFISIILLFSYFISNNKLNNNKYFDFIAFGYLWSTLILISYLVLYNIPSNYLSLSNKILLKINTILSVLFLICIFYTSMCYWVYTTKQISSKYTFYCLGYGVFIFLCGIMISCDMGLSYYLNYEINTTKPKTKPKKQNVVQDNSDSEDE